MTEARDPATSPPLPSWMKEGPGLYPGPVRYLCQMTNDEELFERPKEDGLGVNGYILYDKRSWLTKHFEPNDAVRAALRTARGGAAVLRAIGGEEGFLFSEGTTELRLIEDDRARSVYFYDGLEEDGQRRTIRIGSFFLTADRVLLIDPDRGRLWSLDRAAVMRALSGADAGGDWAPLDINDPGLDQQHFPCGPPAAENAAVLSSFREDAVCFAMASSARHIQYLRVHAFDLKSETIRDYEWPLMLHTDLAFLQPGVIAFPYREGGSVVAHGLAASVNGQDPRSNVYLLDGTPQNDFTNGPAGSAASTVLGASENDQIHFFYHFQEKRNGGSTEQALRHTLLIAGRAIVFATLINAGGFLALALSGLPPMRQFGIISASAFVLSMVASFTALPASLWIFFREVPDGAAGARGRPGSRRAGGRNGRE